MKRTIDFRRGGTQTVDLPGSGESHVTYEGKCPVTGTRLYSCDTGNDPRGPLGWHAVTEFVASEYDKTGPTMVASWLACLNDRSIYAKALAIAQRAWCD